MTSVHPRSGDRGPARRHQDGLMNEPGTRLHRAEGDVEKAEAILDKTEQVLQAIGKVQAAPKGTRVLIRIAAVIVVGGVALLGITVLVSNLRQSRAMPAE